VLTTTLDEEEEEEDETIFPVALDSILKSLVLSTNI
jgi:hypothetical protein